jgi:hypothetical protein
MGIHYLNPELAADAIVDPARPEILLYLPGEGTTRLVGVEYFVAAAATGGVRPEVHSAPFDGPMAGHNDQMPEHYDLHLWIWSHNPDGLTAPWNPALTCPEPRRVSTSTHVASDTRSGAERLRRTGDASPASS